MSGGSFNYFHRRAADDAEHIARTLEDMADRVTSPDAWGREERDAADLEAAGAYLRSIAKKARSLAVDLIQAEEVTHSVEWWCSGDTNLDDVAREFRAVRDKGEQ